MRASTASMILAFCAMLAVQAAPSTTDFEYDAAGNEIEKRGNWEYDAAGNEIEKRDSFEYDAAGNEIEKRGAFEYDAEGNEIEKREDDFEYDAEGNEIEKREPKKKAKKASPYLLKLSKSSKLTLYAGKEGSQKCRCLLIRC